MATSEIEKLERRYADNPHGLTFAPLAEVHRKNGDVARALELLTAGLELHPNYIPASIVLGRCHQDLGDLPAAEAAFAHVLRLDDENVIALKSLADINERLEHFGEAENWLRRLVSVDRSNDEAREQLRRLEARKKDAEVAPEPAAASAPALEVIDLGPERVADVPAGFSAKAEQEPASADALPVHMSALEPSPQPTENARPKESAANTSLAPEVAASAAAEAEASAPPRLEVEEAEPPREAVAPVTGLISAEFEPPLEAIGGLGVETSEEVVLEVSGSSEFRVPDASEDFKDLADRLSVPPTRKPPTPVPEPAAGPVDEGIRGTPEPTPAVAKSHPDQDQIIGRPAPRRSYLARETRGRSVASFFHSLLAARPPVDAARGPGVPSDGRTAGSVADDNGQPAPPAVPGTDQKASGLVSFDDFFGSEKEGSAPARQRGEPGKDDLDQFQTWLQNLKR
jgi:hypothetical protein